MVTKMNDRRTHGLHGAMYTVDLEWGAVAEVSEHETSAERHWHDGRVCHHPCRTGETVL